MSIRDLWNERRITQKIKQALKGKEGEGDAGGLGTGPINRHGMHKLPQGQHEVQKWPVLDLGVQPDIPLDRWSLTVGGLVSSPQTFDWAAFNALPQTKDVSDFHCVTRWSRMDIPWVGVRFVDLMEAVGLKPAGTHVFITGWDDYTTNVSLDEAMKEDVLLVHTAFGEPLPREHGGPVRMITPQLYAWKGAKWVKAIEILDEDRLGFWEQRGYSNTARPWDDDRYS